MVLDGFWTVQVEDFHENILGGVILADPAIRNTQSLGIFESNILKFFRPTPRRFFNCYNPKELD